MLDIKLLDCSLRDGGYYTQWDFEPSLITSYLNAMSTAKIDVIEIGFRNLPQNRFLGALAYCTDEHLHTLPLPKDSLLAVMVNAKELLLFPSGPEAAVDKLFSNKANSPVDIVRIAVQVEEAVKCRSLIDRLKTKGYLVTLNLMQASDKVSESVGAASEITKWRSVDVLYFADTLGNMNVTDIVEALDKIKRVWNGPIGFHAHNNMGNALANTIASLDAGVTWLDGTVMGIGRGAGNAKIEYILLELTKRGYDRYYPNAIFPLVLEDIKKLHQQYNWGENLLYHLSAMYGVHPTYVQEMLGNQRYHAHHMLSVLDFLKNSKIASYNQDNIEAAIQDHSGSPEGTWNPKNLAKGRDVLIIGSGAGVERHVQGLINYVDKKKPLVVCLNISKHFPSEKVNIFATSYKARILMEADKYRLLDKPIVMPKGLVPESILPSLDGVDVLNYGMKVVKNTFSADSTSCIVPFPMVLAYVLAFLTAGEANKILMAGFDGYETGDSRQVVMQKFLEIYEQAENTPPLLAITPTTYTIPQSSVYSPDL